MFESGVGRWEEQYLAPYLFPEYLDLIGHAVPIPVEETLAKTVDACIVGRIDVGSLAEPRRRFLITGGFPELLIARQDMDDETSALLQSQRILRNDAIERAVYKDIPQAFGVDNPMLLERLLYTLAGQFTGVLSPAGICKDLGGLSQPTFDKYLSYLERAFLVFTLANYSGSEASVQKRGRKLYFVDAAIRNAALQRGIGPLSDSSEMGLLLENMVAGHLRALSEINQVRLYHWRDHNDEIDLVFDHPQEPLAFEIGMSAGHHRRGIKAFEARFPRFQGRCYLVSPEIPATLPVENWDGIGTLPIDLFLLAVGGQMERELAGRLIPWSR
jgi:predicted AAA+ superfamily ATPase